MLIRVPPSLAPSFRRKLKPALQADFHIDILTRRCIVVNQRGDFLALLLVRESSEGKINGGFSSFLNPVAVVFRIDFHTLPAVDKEFSDLL